MYERDSLRVLTGVPRNESPRLLRDDEIDISLRTNFKDVCEIGFTDYLPEELRKNFQGLDLMVRSVSGGEPMLYQLYVKEITELDIIGMIDDWAEKEGLAVKREAYSED